MLGAAAGMRLKLQRTTKTAYKDDFREKGGEIRPNSFILKYE